MAAEKSGKFCTTFLFDDTENISTQQVSFTAIPYYSWATRGKGEMSVWFPQQVKQVELITK